MDELTNKPPEIDELFNQYSGKDDGELMQELIQVIAEQKANGTRVVAAVHITVPENLVAVQLHGDESRFNTEEVHIEPRTGKGQPMVMVLMDNVVVKLVRE